MDKDSKKNIIENMKKVNNCKYPENHIFTYRAFRCLDNLNQDQCMERNKYYLEDLEKYIAENNFVTGVTS